MKPTMTSMKITETYAIAVAHHLPTFPEGHKCRNVHGHLIEITITVDVDNGSKGYAFDHAELDVVAGDILRTLDHHEINEIEGLEDGLAETLLAWIVGCLGEAVKRRLDAELVEVHLDEWSSGRTFRLTKHRKSWAR